MASHVRGEISREEVFISCGHTRHKHGPWGGVLDNTQTYNKHTDTHKHKIHTSAQTRTKAHNHIDKITHTRYKHTDTGKHTKATHRYKHKITHRHKHTYKTQAHNHTDTSTHTSTHTSTTPGAGRCCVSERLTYIICIIK